MEERYREIFKEIDRKYEEEKINMPEVVALRQLFSRYNEKRNIGDIQRTFSKGMDANVQDASGNTPCMW